MIRSDPLIHELMEHADAYLPGLEDFHEDEIPRLLWEDAMLFIMHPETGEVVRCTLCENGCCFSNWTMSSWPVFPRMPSGRFLWPRA